MYCFKCGQELPDVAGFCFACGTNIKEVMQGLDNKNSHANESKSMVKSSINEEKIIEKKTLVIEKQSESKKNIEDIVYDIFYCDEFINDRNVLVGVSAFQDEKYFFRTVNMKDYLGMGPNEEIYFFYDSTVFLSGKNGLALGKRGIFMKGNFGRAQMLRWNVFANVEIKKYEYGVVINDVEIQAYVNKELLYRKLKKLQEEVSKSI